MRASLGVLLGAAVAGATGPSACRAVDGVPTVFDLGPGGGIPCPCGDPVPAGWSGPAAVYEGSPGSAPDCPAEYPMRVLDGGTGVAGDPATCSACSCDAPALTCTPGTIDAHSQSSCNGNKSSISPDAGACTPFSPSGSYFEQSPPKVSMGPCAPHGGMKSLPAPTWKTEAVACAIPGGVPPCFCPASPPIPFEGRTCVYRAGAHACPAQFPVARGWDSPVDTRGCSPCACGPAMPAVTCTVTTELFGDGQCQSALSNVGAPGQCGGQTGVHSLLATPTFSATPSCAASGGTPEGDVTGAQAVTVCCAP